MYGEQHLGTHRQYDEATPIAVVHHLHRRGCRLWAYDVANLSQRMADVDTRRQTALRDASIHPPVRGVTA
jgi:hypothetical protein